MYEQYLEKFPDQKMADDYFKKMFTNSLTV